MNPPLCPAMARIAALSLAAWMLLTPAHASSGAEVGWDNLPGWSADRHAEAWPALLQSCRKLSNQEAWRNICQAADRLSDPGDGEARAFFEQHFHPHRLQGDRGQNQGLITGYYEPLLAGSFKPDDRYRYPLYRPPESLLTVNLDPLFPELNGKRVRGRLENGKVAPFYSRAEIDGEANPLRGNELLWVDNREALFFLHVQGSGRVRLPDGSLNRVGYADHNGHPYVSIGKLLVEQGELERGEVSMFTIRRWLDGHPDQARDLLNSNPRYIFFALRENPGSGPIGALGVPLTAERSVAIDPKVVSLGSPLWLSTNRPGEPENPYRRLVMAQDTGSAIKGALRADLFWGHGPQAEQAAGIMQEPGEIYLLLPRAREH